MEYDVRRCTSQILNNEGGFALIMFALCVAMLLALFGLAHETYLLVSEHNQTENDSRGAAFVASASYFKALDQQQSSGPPDYNSAEEYVEQRVSQYFPLTVSKKRGGESLIQYGNNGSNWTTSPDANTDAVMVDMKNIVHKPGGFSSVIALAARSHNIYQGSTLSSSAYSYYDGTNAKQGLFPIVTVSK